MSRSKITIYARRAKLPIGTRGFGEVTITVDTGIPIREYTLHVTTVTYDRDAIRIAGIVEDDDFIKKLTGAIHG